jgi:hypothetical protein
LRERERFKQGSRRPWLGAYCKAVENPDPSGAERNSQNIYSVRDTELASASAAICALKSASQVIRNGLAMATALNEIIQSFVNESVKFIETLIPPDINDYHKALGQFVSAFSMVETCMQQALWRQVGITAPIAPAVFSGTRTEAAGGFLRRMPMPWNGIKSKKNSWT